MKQCIAIIGAGLTGLTLANELKDKYDIEVFEKSYGAGGRISTRDKNNHEFDHGAQYFTSKTPEFEAFIHPMLEKGIIDSWNVRFAEIENRKINHTQEWNNDHPHYVGTPNMSAIGQYLSRNINLHFKKQVNSISKYRNGWLLEDEQSQKLGHFDWVITTIPVQQAINIIPLSTTFHKDLLNIKMKGCYSLMLGLKKDLEMDFEAALVKDEDISWISVNNSKPKRQKKFNLLVHSTNQWADENIDVEQTLVAEHLHKQVNDILGLSINDVAYIDLHRWRYANIARQKNNSTYFIDQKNKIATCGDWCIQGRVESAFLSAHHLAQTLRNIIDMDQW